MVNAHRRPQRLTGPQRAAGLLIALGPELAGKVLSSLPPDVVEQLTWEITHIGPISAEQREAVLAAAYDVAAGQDFVSTGGIEAAMAILERAFGAERARELAGRAFGTFRAPPFAFTRELDAIQLVSFLANEHPQTLALVLSYMTPEKAATVLAELQPPMQAPVALRIARMDRTAPEVVREVEDLLQRQLAGLLTQRPELKQVGGVDTLVTVLKSLDRTTERALLEALEGRDPPLAEEVKAQLFTFEHIVQLDDRSVQRVLRDVDLRDLALALKGAGEEVRRRVLTNMSARAAAMLEEDMAVLGPVRLRTIAEAQGRIVTIIRALDAAEEIIIARDDDAVLL